MVEGSCLCGAVTYEVESAPEAVTSCNCSSCRRTGGLWAYYRPDQVRVSGETVGFTRSVDGDPPMLTTHHCPICGCLTHWSPLIPGSDRMAVNARLMDPEVLAAARVRQFDGAVTWTFPDEVEAEAQAESGSSSEA